MAPCRSCGGVGVPIIFYTLLLFPEHIIENDTNLLTRARTYDWFLFKNQMIKNKRLSILCIVSAKRLKPDLKIKAAVSANHEKIESINDVANFKTLLSIS